MNDMDRYFKTYFGVWLQSQTYLNLAYLLLSFPLGLFYFVFLITGLSIGVPLIILLVGVLILAAVLAASWALAAFERVQAESLLRVKIPPMARPGDPNAGFWQRVRDYLTNPVTWKGLLYLVCKFPLGIINFTLVVTVVSVVLAMVAAPFIYPWATIDLGFTVVNSLTDALMLTVIGVLLAPAGLHLLNFLARIQGEFARVMLGLPAHQVSAPVTQAVPTSLVETSTHPVDDTTPRQ